MNRTLKQAVEDSFATYAAMTIQHRAIIDSRDGLKPAARMAVYSQYLDKLVYPKPHRKSHKSITSAMDHFYVHGDASMYQLLARMARKITMRYPIEDSVGDMGTYTLLDNPASPRYTEMRLGEIGVKMIDGVDKDTIDVWFDNFDNTEKFPSVLPSLGFYNIVNGTTGIATSLSSSIPQFNLREVNEAMIKLLWNPDIDFEEIYCPPDFITGGTILNADEVKESLRTGHGKSCIIRGDVIYDEKENAIIVKSVPYGVATDTIKHQIAAMFEMEGNVSAGIERFVDSSEEIVDITIWLSKGANPNRVIKNLYKYTNIQYYFPINMIMLENGTSPKLFSWKEALQTHLNHEIDVRTRIHIYDLARLRERENILNGYLLAYSRIDEVIAIIRSSPDSNSAKKTLMEKIGFNKEQVDVVAKMGIIKLNNMDITSHQNEKIEVTNKIQEHLSILEDKTLLYKEIEEDLRKVIDIYENDTRRTELINLNYKGQDEDIEPVEEKSLLIHHTNKGNLYIQESTTLVKTNRGGKGTKIKLSANEAIIDTLNDTNLNSLFAFSNKGRMFSIAISELPVNAKINLNQLFELAQGEKINLLTSFSKKDNSKYLTFVTKNGMIKKTKLNEYLNKRGKSIQAIKLKEDDEVQSVHLTNSENIGILTSQGNFVIIKTSDINDIGRVSMGVKAINLSKDDYVIDAKLCTGDRMITISSCGLIKKSKLSEFSICNRGIKGKKISGTRENDEIVKFLTLDEDSDIIIISNKGLIKINTDTLRFLSREATGVKAMSLPEDSRIVDLVKA